MAYRIDLNAPSVLVPCTFVPSSVPGKTLCVNEDGGTLVVLPDGTQRPGPDEPANSPNWDSPWTQATVLSGFLVYRSPSGPNTGVPRGYRMVV
jgi:hypothetical protein